MRFILILILITASACVASTDELMAEANRTGNWDRVNDRFAAEDERQAVLPACRGGTVLLCESNLGEETCACTKMDRINFGGNTIGNRAAINEAHWRIGRRY